MKVSFDNRQEQRPNIVDVRVVSARHPVVDCEVVPHLDNGPNQPRNLHGEPVPASLADSKYQRRTDDCCFHKLRVGRLDRKGQLVRQPMRLGVREGIDLVDVVNVTVDFVGPVLAWLGRIHKNPRAGDLKEKCLGSFLAENPLENLHRWRMVVAGSIDYYICISGLAFQDVEAVKCSKHRAHPASVALLQKRCLLSMSVECRDRKVREFFQKLVQYLPANVPCRSGDK